jgi:hypothetical protein
MMNRFHAFAFNFSSRRYVTVRVQHARERERAVEQQLERWKQARR